MLTKLEEQVLMTVWRFDGKGYGVNIFEYLEKNKLKKVTMGVVYDTLERLRKRELLEYFMGEATPVRGGMRKKYYRITDEGVEALERSKSAHDRIMEGFADLFKRHKDAKELEHE